MKNSTVFSLLYCVTFLYFGTLNISAVTVLSFQDAVTSSGMPGGVNVRSHYSDVGVNMPNMRFHVSTQPANLPFPFIDDFGIVINAGLTVPAPGDPSKLDGVMQFLRPVDFVTADVFFGRQTVGTVFSWSLIAYDASLSFVGEVSDTLTSVDESVLMPSSLTLNAAGQISFVVIRRSLVIGVDTLTFGPDYTGGTGSPPAMPENAHSLTLLIAGFAFAFVTNRKNGVLVRV